MEPPVKSRYPFEVTFNDPVLLSPLPTALKITSPPDTVIPEGSPKGSSVPRAVFSSLPAIFTVPSVTINAPSTCVCTELPELVPKFAVPDVTLIKPLLVMEKLPVLSEPPFTSNPELGGIFNSLLYSQLKDAPPGILINPPFRVRLPPPDIVVFPFIVRVVARLSFVIVSSSKVVVPSI